MDGKHPISKTNKLMAQMADIDRQSIVKSMFSLTFGTAIVTNEESDSAIKFEDTPLACKAFYYLFV